MVARARALVVLIGLLLSPAATVVAEEPPPPPTPAYTGGIITETSTFTGDWRGARNALATKGITLDANVTQVEQGVVSGGKDGAWEYGGRGDMNFALDTGKLGLWPGGFLNVELEGNWGDSVNTNAGALLPPDTNQLFPVPTERDVGLPNLTFTQFASRYVGALVGKLQVLSPGDMNAFAHGKGASQFMNLAFNANPSLMVVPYSTLAAGLLVLPTADINEAIVKFVVLSATGTATTSGFDNLDGAIFLTEGRLRTGFFGLTGHQLLGALYSNKEYVSLDPRVRFVFENRALPKSDDSWSVWYNFDQYLYQPTAGADRGIGVFGRFGASKGDPVPAQYFLSFGLGGKAPFERRPFDQCGIGYYYVFVDNPTVRVGSFTKSFLRDEWGFEAYYNFALTPWLLLTPDVQVIGPSQKRQFISLGNRPSIGTATILGLRIQVLL